eukprot:gb/GECG01008298.1/.p1 GENE.gb/GECG01008298.1/~~gb/GECG01008298.1/.p1  ORF type:complete len:572 (+),score=69.56 gb/GECG01008298.1/:1-1716(+)
MFRPRVAHWMLRYCPAPPVVHLHRQTRGLCSSSFSLYERAVGLIQASKSSGSGSANDERLVEAYGYLQEAAQHGHLAAKGRLGRWKLLGVGPFARERPPLVDAHNDLHEAAVADDPDAQYWLGRLWLDPSRFSQVTYDDEENDARTLKAIEEDLNEEDLQAYQDVDPDKKKQVFKEVRQSRRLARINRNKRARGLPEVKSLQDLSSNDQDKSFLYRDIDPRRMTLHPDEDRGVYWLQCAADQHNHPEANILLGNMALEQSDVVTAQLRYERAAFGRGIDLISRALQDTKGEDSTGTLLKGINAIDPSGACRWIAQWVSEESSKVSSFVDAFFNLGQLYWNGESRNLIRQRSDMPREGEITFNLDSVMTQLALGCFAYAAANGDPSSQYWLGQLYHWGDSDRNIPIDGKLASEYLFRAAEKNHGGAELYLSRLYREGSKTLELEQNRDVSVQLLIRACAHEESDALYELGTCYATGSEEFEQDYENAFNAFVKGAALNHSECLLNAGVMAYNGLGTEKDKRRAFLFYQKAGENGNLQAWSNLAAMYAVGEGGVEKNLPVARYLREFVERMSS